jgi:hypothetical protein
MRFRQMLLYGLFAFVSRSAEPQVTTAAAPLGAACTRLNHDALARVAQGRSVEVEKLLLAALAGSGGPDRVCAGVVMNNIAALLMVSGRMEEAEAMAERSVCTLEDFLPAGDPGLLRPLQILAQPAFNEGRPERPGKPSGRCRPFGLPGPRIAGWYLPWQDRCWSPKRKMPEAESEYFATFQALKELGRGETADAATLLESIGALYVRENRIREAREMLDQAFAVFGRAANTVPWDRGRLLHHAACCTARGPVESSGAGPRGCAGHRGSGIASGTGGPAIPVGRLCDGPSEEPSATRGPVDRGAHCRPGDRPGKPRSGGCERTPSPIEGPLAQTG